MKNTNRFMVIGFVIYGVLIAVFITLLALIIEKLS